MRIKELKRTVNVCWSPAESYPVVLATGSAAQQVDASFSSNSQLDLFTLNLKDPGLDLELKSSVQTQHKFHKLVWSGAGVLAGGCDNGLIEFYSADKLIKGSSDALLGTSNKHNGHVTCLDVNPFQKNLLSSGASDSEIFIWDLNNTGQPMAPGNKSQPLEQVQGLAWNQQVQHILGSTFPTRCVVWDLRKNEPIMKLSDSSSRPRWRSVAWHPAVATQLALASDHDHHPVIQIWDLRLASTPLATFEGHQKGVMSLSWSSRDPSMLFSGGKDGQILCWNPNTTQQTSALSGVIHQQSPWVLSVAQCPRDPALLSVASADDLAVHTVLPVTRTSVSKSSENSILESFGGACSLSALPVAAPSTAAPAPPLATPPRWLRPHTRASFTFDGKLVTFEKGPEEAGSQKLVYISQVVSEPEFVERAEGLNALMQHENDHQTLAEYCRSRGDSCSDQSERYLWFFLRARFMPDFREEALNLLGFKQDEIPSKFKGPSSVSGYSNHVENNVDSLTSGVGLSRGESTETEAELSTDTSTDLSDAHTLIDRKLAQIEDSTAKNIVIPNGDDPTSLICRALACGNYEEAVELCLEAKRVSDALVIASLGGPALSLRTHLWYLSRESGPISAIAKATLSQRWMDLVNTSSPSSWRTVLAALLRHASEEDLNACCAALGAKLSSSSEPGECAGAGPAYVCGGAAAGGDLLTSAEVALLVQMQTGASNSTPIQQLALKLAGQGQLTTALNVLRHQQCALKDRITVALGQQPKPSNQPSSQYRQPQTYQHQQYQRQQAQGRHDYGDKRQGPESVRPPSSASVARPPSTGPHAGGISSRSKYKVDPSVQSAPLYGQYNFNQVQQQSYGYGGPISDQYSASSVPSQGFNPVNPAPLNPLNPAPLNHMNPTPMNPLNPTAMNPTPLNHMNPAPLNPVQPSPSVMNPGIGAPVVNGSYYGSDQQPVKPAPPGWNDPPMMTAKPKPKPEVQAQAPITHPLFGVEPPQHIPLNPSAQYDQQYQTQQFPAQQFQAQPYQAQQFQPQQQQQGYAQQGYGQQNYPAGYPQQSESPRPAVSAPPPPPPKAAIPAEHLVLQTVLDGLRAQCAERASNPQMKRKLEDVQRRLETLYDMLREYRLSESALSSLHMCCSSAQNGDYGQALDYAAALAGGADFASVASFLPALKSLMQTASMLMQR